MRAPRARQNPAATSAAPWVRLPSRGRGRCPALALPPARLHSSRPPAYPRRTGPVQRVCRGCASAVSPESGSNLLEMILVVVGDFVEFLLQRAHTHLGVHELQMSVTLVEAAGMVDRRSSHGFEHTARDIERDVGVVELVRP